MDDNRINVLKNWSIDHFWDGSVVIYGEIYNDSKNRFQDGTQIRTSRVRRIDFEEGIVETRNSTYILEKRSRR